VLQFLLHRLLDLHGVDAHLLKYEVGHLTPFLQDAMQQVHRLDGLLAGLLGSGYCFLNSLLGLDRKFVECHILLLSFNFLSFYTRLVSNDVPIIRVCHLGTEM
jgi:hypothetical protein